MIGFLLRAIGLATLCYFIFVLPIGRKTVAQEAADLWEQKRLGHALQVKVAYIGHELALKVQAWKKEHDRQSASQAEADARSPAEAQSESDANLGPGASEAGSPQPTHKGRASKPKRHH